MKHSIAIKKIIDETSDCISIEFEIPDSLKKTFEYHPGQHITLCAQINGKEERRSYSLCSSPLENKWQVAVKKVVGGVFSTWLHTQSEVLQKIDLLPPQGSFFKNNIEENKKYLLLAAGSGITPIISIIKYILETTKNTSITLVYGNKKKDNIIFLEQLESIKNKNISRVQFFQVLSQQHQEMEFFNGRIDNKKLEQLNKITPVNNYDGYFICGPETMIDSCNDYLLKQNVAKNDIYFERFGAAKNMINKMDVNVTSDLPFSQIQIKIDGRNFNYELPFNTQTILDAAIAQGADMPYACKGGVCCTCKAKLLVGKVNMAVCYGLEQEEIDAGYILTCQSYPVTEKVLIDFDV